MIRKRMLALAAAALLGLLGGGASALTTGNTSASPIAGHPCASWCR